MFDLEGKPCYAPDHAIVIKSSGMVLSDIMQKGNYGNLWNNSLSEILNSKERQEVRETISSYRLHKKYCDTCIKKDLLSGDSRRRFFYRLLSKEDLSKSSIKVLELNASNKCNLSCSMCNGATSTGWQAIEKSLTDSGVDFNRSDQIDYKTIVHEDKSIVSIIEKEIHLLEDLKYFFVRGGEPMYDGATEDFCWMLIRNGIAKNVTLDMSTNGTQINDNWREIFKNFKSVQLSISIEATDDLYKYVRGGSKHSHNDIIDVINFYKSDNTEIILVVCTSAHSIYGFKKLVRWWKNNISDHKMFVNNVVAKPTYLDPSVLPKVEKEKLKQEVLEVKDLLQIDAGWENIIRSLDRDSDEYEKFIEFTRILDKHRKLEWGKIVGKEIWFA